MSAAERKFFEAQLSKDPLLQNEVNFHKDVIEGLQDYRKKELKERLRNIEVKGGNSYTGIKVAASILALSLIGFGTYYFTSTKEEVKAPIVQTIEQPKVEPSAQSEPEKTTAQVTENVTTAKKANKVKESVSRKETGTIKTTAEDRIPMFNAPVLKEQYEDDQVAARQETDAPSTSAKTVPSKVSAIEIKIEESKNKLQYQHYNNKLFLYGDFNSKPYEILELNTNKEKKLYLYFEDKYYGIKSNQTKIANLEEIKNAKLIESLKALRDK